MFGYSMVTMVRKNAHKLDRPLREILLNFYKPFKWTPCFLHNVLEGWMKKTKKLQLVVEFEESETPFRTAFTEVNKITRKHFGCKVRKEFPLVSCISAEISPLALEEILNSCTCIKRVYLNREVQALLDVAVPSVNAKNVVRNETTLTGEGVTVAVIDTGIHPHQDLQGRIVNFVDFVNQQTEPYDDNGHGTHCAGDAVGNGSASSGKYMGPAPKANVIGVKVLDKMGSGSLETVMEGIDWCIKYNEDPNNTPKIDIISMSLGSAPTAYERENDDPMVQYVELAWNSGIVVCVAAGNDGPDEGTIASPGISDQVITVGALDDRDTAETREDDDVANFSSRGPTPYGVTKPDILAPGVNIVSLRSPNSYLDKLQKSNRVDSNYVTLSGTSMATPICAGVVALILQANPDTTPNEVKELLRNGATLWGERDPNIYGSGYINADNSIPM
ncbi:S8 family peptidase [Priestia endophytica]|uniref:S8 family peptidase n=1 Tax=Priestia endophytica TaxID=135735 RepID=UPI0022827DF9|nr:S8 family peptidase [Priestia endophytica]MCY8233773.1 S8 family peptidase [Priestia endophytica]